jgi:DNA-binding CsgD family transcriptional regulator
VAQGVERKQLERGVIPERVSPVRPPRSSAVDSGSYAEVDIRRVRRVPGRLVGRDEELSTISDFIDRLATEGGALILTGEPGVGKTVLLDAARALAESAGARVLRTTGVEFEADLSFSALNQALLPLADKLDLLAESHRDALSVALGLGDGPAPHRHVVANAALALLQLAAATSPVLLIIDDLPWLDRASAGVYGFLARNATANGIGFMGAARDESESFFDLAGLPVCDVAPLDPVAADGLVDSSFPDLAPAIRERLLAEARGNPLALLELPATIGGQLSEMGRSLPAVLPLNRRLQALFSARIAALPAPTFQLLLRAALDGSGDLVLLAAAGAADGLDLDCLDPAIDVRLIYLDAHAHRLVFRHPLVRSAIVGFATAAECRLAHRAVAAAVIDQPDRHAWHLAEALIEPDEHVADLLEQAALRVLRRGDAVSAVSALMRSAELSPQVADRGKRLAAAAVVGAEVAGEVRRVGPLLAEARRLDPALSRSLEAATAAANALINADGDIDTAHRLLVAVLERTSDGIDVGDAAVEEAIHTLFMVCFFGGRVELWKHYYAAVQRLTPTASSELFLLTRLGTDPARATRSDLDRLETAIDGLLEENDPIRTVRIASASVFVDRLPRCRAALERAVADARVGGAYTTLIRALILLGYDDFLSGRWDEAERRINECLVLCRAHGYQLLEWPVRSLEAAMAGARGDYETTRTAAAELMQWAVPRGARAVQAYAWHAHALAALGRGDFDYAYEQVTQISPAGTLASHQVYALWSVMDLVEAAVRTGRQTKAEAHVAAMREADIASLSPRLALLSAGSAAIAAPGDSALQLFEDALATPEAEQWPFTLARIQLAYGERLRRSRASVESRRHLGAALETFDRLRAEPWSARAATELLATGQVRLRTADDGADSLTSQEREIAMLAATGLTNKQIAQRLLLSHRTVGAHLSRVYPKLGISSRAALRDALGPADERPTGG